MVFFKEFNFGNQNILNAIYHKFEDKSFTSFYAQVICFVFRPKPMWLKNSVLNIV